MIGIMLGALDALWGEGASERRLAAGEALFRSGDPVRFLYRVETGAVNLVRPLTHGAELVLQRARAGALLAEASLFAERYHCDAVAGTDARIRGVARARVAEALDRDPALALSLARDLALKVQNARARAEIVSLRTVAARLDGWLAVQAGGLPGRGRWRELAGEIGVTPEALYRELAARRKR